MTTPNLYPGDLANSNRETEVKSGPCNDTNVQLENNIVQAQDSGHYNKVAQFESDVGCTNSLSCEASPDSVNSRNSTEIQQCEVLSTNNKDEDEEPDSKLSRLDGEALEKYTYDTSDHPSNDYSGHVCDSTKEVAEKNSQKSTNKLHSLKKKMLQRRPRKALVAMYHSQISGDKNTIKIRIKKSDLSEVQVSINLQ